MKLEVFENIQHGFYHAIIHVMLVWPADPVDDQRTARGMLRIYSTENKLSKSTAIQRMRVAPVEECLEVVFDDKSFI